LWKAFREIDAEWRAHREWPELGLPLIGGYFGPRDGALSEKEVETVMKLVFKRFYEGREVSAILGMPNTATPLARALSGFMPNAVLLEMDKETGELSGVNERTKDVLLIDNALTTAATLFLGRRVVQDAGLTIVYTAVLYDWQLGGLMALDLAGNSIDILRNRQDLFDSWTATGLMSKESRARIDENCLEFKRKAERRILAQVP
ncbi:phosphoribosyltransferase, partial [Patescibacteria group bacterium]|nr:phosphoribosyltransferase [Patescibacteria group bacterium]